MIKELMLVPRVLYVGLFMLIGAMNAPFGISWLVFAFFFLFILSFVWQYYVLTFAMRPMNKKGRGITIIVWLFLSFMIGLWGLESLIAFDYLQNDFQKMMKSFSWWMTVYLIGASMFIGGACTRRTFTIHKAL